jgi:hypothetical protein
MIPVRKQLESCETIGLGDPSLWLSWFFQHASAMIHQINEERGPWRECCATSVKSCRVSAEPLKWDRTDLFAIMSTRPMTHTLAKVDLIFVIFCCDIAESGCPDISTHFGWCLAPFLHNYDFTFMV